MSLTGTNQSTNNLVLTYVPNTSSINSGTVSIPAITNIHFPLDQYGQCNYLTTQYNVPQWVTGQTWATGGVTATPQVSMELYNAEVSRLNLELMALKKTIEDQKINELKILCEHAKPVAAPTPVTENQKPGIPMRALQRQKQQIGFFMLHKD